jgi:hypothetical protein
MTITMTLREVLKRCNDWDYFCEEEGWSIWCINEGGGDLNITLTEEKCYRYGILKKNEYQ